MARTRCCLSPRSSASAVMRSLMKFSIVLCVSIMVTSFYKMMRSGQESVCERAISNPAALVEDTRTLVEQTTTPRRSSSDCHTIHRHLNSCSTLPNYFMYSDGRPDFHNPILNFWHVQKAGGSSFEHCLVEMYDSWNLPETVRVGRGCEFKLEMLQVGDYFKNETYRPIIRGHDAIGVCDFLKERITDRKCSTFAIFREPIEREVSLYFYVRKEGATDNPHPQKWVNALNQTISEWIKTARSVMWEAVSNDYEIFNDPKSGHEKCKMVTNITGDYKYQYPVVDDYLRDIVDNLDKHLSVVGLLEDLPTTYAMLEEAYKLPLVEACSGVYQQKGTYGEEGGEFSGDELKEKAIRDILEDEEVMKLLEFDILVYEKAKEIFYKQREIFRKMKTNR